jgi:predicted O-methyltransferase YrrM
MNSPAGSPDIPFPIIDLSVDNPIPDIINAAEFSATAAAVADTAASKRSLISAVSGALIYTLVRNARPQHVVEIGTYNGGTSELICRALHQNGGGTLHTVGPFDRDRVMPIFRSWPRHLRERLRFYPMMSMEFYYELAARGIKPEIAFIDGDHSYEAALYDIQSLARTLVRRGFLIVDNIAQSGPFYASADFSARNSDWIRCDAHDAVRADPTKAFDRERTTIPETDFAILRAPQTYNVTSRPFTFGEFLWGPTVRGLQIQAETCGGILHAQCVLRGFGPKTAQELVISGHAEIRSPGPVTIMFPGQNSITDPVRRCTVETWLTWTGEQPLRLTGAASLLGATLPTAARVRNSIVELIPKYRLKRPFLVRPLRNRSRLRQLASRFFRVK